MKTLGIRLAIASLLSAWAGIALAAGNEPPAACPVPGVIIDHSPASSGAYIGSPGLAVLPNGDYVASHDYFGPGTKGDTTAVFRSADRGRTWQKLAVVKGQFWASLFTHNGALYLLGTRPGPIVIRRSDDGGRTWTEPNSADTGLLTADDQHYHCAPTPVIVHDGRLWRGFERTDTRKVGGAQLTAGMISAPVGADLLKAASWTVGRFVPGERAWLGGLFLSWREGNAVVDRSDRLLNIIRVDSRILPERAAIIHVSDDGRDATFDPNTDFIEFPGGSKKFTIRYDARSNLYWSLANLVPREFQHRAIPGSVRNTLALIASADLRHWDVRRIVLEHLDSTSHGFQYVDWLFEGDDLIAACRTAYDDGVGGAHNFHDANYLTFDRIANFREKTAVPTAPPDELTLMGRGWSLARLDNGQRAFANRDYVWQDVPAAFRNWRFTQTAGGDRADLRVRSERDTTLFAMASSARVKTDLAGWKTAPDAMFHYSDKGHTPMTICWRIARAGEEVALTQASWAGTLLLLPPDAAVHVQPGDLPPGQVLARLKYNNPGLTVDLGVGLWAFPLPMDFNGDGRLDMVVDCPDKPYNGVYVFENPGVDTARNPLPVFKPGRRISPGLQMAQLSLVDGRPRVLGPAMEFTDFRKSGLDGGVKLPLPANVHPNKVRGNFWRYVDFDGDGKLDIIVGADDWTDYGWDNAYDAGGHWTRGPLRGFVYLIRNTGTNEKPVYEKPVLVLTGRRPVETFGWPCPNFADFRGTGKLDLICGEFRDSFTFFENIGTRVAPKYAPGRLLTLPPPAGAAGGAPRPLTMDLEMITPVAIDWNKDGHVDLICGDEDGRVAYIENTGRLAADGTPQFLPPRYFQQEADELKCGALATPVGVDWDGDGAIDIISGNSAGYLMFFKNLSGPGVEKPKWAAPQYLQADGRVIRFMAGPNGSIQGPAEAKWGYTTLSVADWDGDGLPDLIVNSILGKVVWFKNIGTRQSPKLAAAQPIEVEWDGPQPALSYGWLRPEGKALLTQWRTTPVAVDWNKDGLMDLVMLDQEGYLAYFERARRDGRLVLLPPKRVLCNEKGEPLRLSAGIAGRSGRRKLCIVDWDGDGRLDILLNAANARFLRQVDARDGKWFFKDMGPLSEQNIEGHDVSPTVVDFNGDGIPDFLGGAEDGHFYYLRNPRTKDQPLCLKSSQGTLTLDARGLSLVPVSPACPPVRAQGEPLWAVLLQKDVPPPITEDPLVLTDQGQPVKRETTSQGIRLTYEALTGGGKVWQIGLTLSFCRKGQAFEVTGEIRNREPGWIVCGFTGPVLHGIETDLSRHPALMPDGFGRRIQRPPSPGAKNPAPWRQAGKHFEIDAPYPSREGTMQWCALAGPEGGLYFGCHDAGHAAKTFSLRCDPAQGPLGLAIKQHGFCRTGESWSLPPVVLEHYEGPWHVAAKTYRAWIDAETPLRPAPAWLQNASGWLLCILKQQNGEVLWDYPSLATLATVADRRGLDVLGLFGWAHGGHDHLYPDYHPDPLMGGSQALRRGLQEIHRQGKRAIIYANGQLEERDTPFWNTQGKDLAVIQRDGTTVQEIWHKFKNAPAYHFDHGCLAAPGWCDRMLALALQANELGADGILFDQLGNTRATACYAAGHGHPAPAMVYAADRVRLLRRIADHMQKINPEFILMTEGLHDSVLDSVGLFHGCVRGVEATAPAEMAAAPRATAAAFPELFRYTFPELMSTIRVPTPMLTRAMANYACLYGFRYEIESRYAPDVRYLKEGQVPDARQYEQVVSKPDIPAMQATPPAEATRYLKRLIEFQRTHAAILWRGQFTDNEGFSFQGTGLVAKSYAADGQRGVLVWNPTDQPAALTLQVPGATLVSATEPEAGAVEPSSPLGPHTLRLLVWKK